MALLRSFLIIDFFFVSFCSAQDDFALMTSNVFDTTANFSFSCPRSLVEGRAELSHVSRERTNQPFPHCKGPIILSWESSVRAPQITLMPQSSNRQSNCIWRSFTNCSRLQMFQMLSYAHRFLCYIIHDWNSRYPCPTMKDQESTSSKSCKTAVARSESTQIMSELT